MPDADPAQRIVRACETVQEKRKQLPIQRALNATVNES
jgi:hypothetical protein